MYLAEHQTTQPLGEQTRRRLFRYTDSNKQGLMNMRSSKSCVMLTQYILMRKEATWRKPLKSSWDRLKLSPQTMIMEASGVIHGHYASLTPQGGKDSLISVTASYQLRPILLQHSPLIPNVGPWEGCRIHAKQFFCRCADIAWDTPMVVVLFPSPNGVGVMLEWKI